MSGENNYNTNELLANNDIDEGINVAGPPKRRTADAKNLTTKNVQFNNGILLNLFVYIFLCIFRLEISKEFKK